MIKDKLREIYKRYGFEVAKIYSEEEVIVFTLKTGYFDNADIVPLNKNSNTEKAFSDFSKAGYACTTRDYVSPEKTELELFKGFFSVSTIIDRLKKDYNQFTENIVRPFSDDAKYKYINAPYSVNGKIGEKSPAEEVIFRLNEKKPILFLIEAAAGLSSSICALFCPCDTFTLTNCERPARIGINIATFKANVGFCDTFTVRNVFICVILS